MTTYEVISLLVQSGSIFIAFIGLIMTIVVLLNEKK